MITNDSRIKGCILGGAIADAFGAPLEGIRSIDELTQKFGPSGLQEFIPYKGHWKNSAPAALGVVTDDTTMLACTIAGIIEAEKLSPEEILHKQWQYYLAWGSHQEKGEKLASFIQPSTTIPAYLQPFLYRCGAGRGTIAALSSGNIDNSQQPNAGCGSMMRIAPIAFLSGRVDTIALTRQNAAITHGHIDAVNATIAIVLLIENCLKLGDLTTALSNTKQAIPSISDHQSVLSSWLAAETAFANHGISINAMELLGRANDENPFLALPVLRQVIYCLLAASHPELPSAENFKQIIRLSANHSGDSDSVAAIVGNCLGAAWGVSALPEDWVEILELKEELNDLIGKYVEFEGGHVK